MNKVILSLTFLSLLALLGGVSVFAGQATQTQSPSSSQTAETPHHAKKAVHHHHAAANNLTAQYAAGVQDLAGTISMVDANQKVVVVTDSNGVPFDFVVTPRTRIQVNGQKSNLDALGDQTNKQASIKYRDLRKRGQVAQSITVSE